MSLKPFSRRDWLFNITLTVLLGALVGGFYENMPPFVRIPLCILMFGLQALTWFSFGKRAGYREFDKLHELHDNARWAGEVEPLNPAPTVDGAHRGGDPNMIVPL